MSLLYGNTSKKGPYEELTPSALAGDWLSPQIKLLNRFLSFPQSRSMPTITKIMIYDVVSVARLHACTYV